MGWNRTASGQVAVGPCNTATSLGPGAHSVKCGMAYAWCREIGMYGHGSQAGSRLSKTTVVGRRNSCKCPHSLTFSDGALSHTGRLATGLALANEHYQA